MRGMLLSMLLVLCVLSSKGQLAVGEVNHNKGLFKVKELALLKSSKTIFICPDNTEEEYQKELSSVWDITPFEVMSHSDYTKRKEELEIVGNSIFAINGVYRTRYGAHVASREFSEKTYISLTLISYGLNRRGKKEAITYCTIRLFPKFSCSRASLESYYKDSSCLRNWQLGFLKGYLGVINNYLKDSKKLSLYSKGTSQNLSKLRDATLYIPDYVLRKFNKFNGNEEKKRSVESLMEGYKYKYKIVTAEELNKLILSKTPNPIYYLIYVKSSTDKHISVFESKTSEMLYWKYINFSYNIKKADFANLYKSIGKSVGPSK